jgi:putative ABC transport system substrate-binding protein
MRRREFLGVVGGSPVAFVTASFIARAQQGDKLPTIGFLGVATASAWSQSMPAFLKRLQETGWTEGRNVAVEYRWAEGRRERFAEIAAEFVRLKVNVIVTAGGAVIAAKQATATIPIVFAVASDPVGSGLVASLARPGGNVTGLSVQASDLVGKRVELLREIVPNLRTLGIIANVDYPAAKHEMSEVAATARAMGLSISVVEIRRADDIAAAIETIKGRVEALYVAIDAVTDANRDHIANLALAARLPLSTGFREAIEAGGLVFYGPNVPDLFGQAAGLVDKILRGIKPSDIPVQQPTKFDLVINLKVAKALDLVVPPSLLGRADEVIE